MIWASAPGYGKSGETGNGIFSASACSLTGWPTVCAIAAQHPNAIRRSLQISVRPQHGFLLSEATRNSFLQQLPQTRAFNSLVYSIGFDYRMVQWCGMHVVHLGIGLHANGGGMHELLQHHHFQGATEHARFASAFASFKLWCRTNGVECSQSAFKPWMLVTKGEEFCYLQTKAAILSGVSGYVFFHSPQIKSEPHYK